MSLHSIDVETNTNGSEFDHAEITLSAGAWRSLNTPGVTSADVWKAYIDVGGIIARVALHASPWVVAASARHGCTPKPITTPRDDALGTPSLQGCNVSGLWPAVLAPGTDLNEPPTACFLIPADELTTWVERIGIWLDTVARDAAARPAVAAPEPDVPPPLRLIQPGRAS